MTNITIYGKPSSGFEYIKMRLSTYLEKAGLEIQFNEITSTEEFLKYEIKSIPSVQFKDQMFFQENESINSFIYNISQQILKENKFGNMERIIVPFDFSEQSENALRYAIEIAKSKEAVIQLVHAFQPEAVAVEGYPMYDSEIEKNKKKEMKQYLGELRKQWVGSTERPFFNAIFEYGFPIEVVLRNAQKNENSIVVIGSTGKGGSLKKLFGSVSTGVARKCKQPVFIIPPDVNYTPIKRIAYCSENIEQDSRSIVKLMNWINHFDAELHILHFDNDKPYISDAVLKLWGNFIPKEKLKIETLYGGDIMMSVNAYCKQNDIDLLSMYPHKRSFMSNLLHKSMTKKMTINTELPLMILHDQ